jgi:hypothetical protein
VPGWESLRVDLRRVKEESPGALVVHPNTESERHVRRKPPFRIELAPWATDIAAELNAKYADLLDLRVGAMTFPAGQLWVSEHARQLSGVQPTGLEVESLSPLSVRTGRHTRQDVLVTNRSARRHVLVSNGALRSALTDSSGNLVGLYVGPHNANRVEFWIEPDQSRPVPVFIGTASMVPDLGYAVPPGRWSLVIVPMTDSGPMRSAPLEISVTP